MEYGKIIAVTGLSGLFELLTSKNDGAIVRSLEDKTTRFVASRVHNFSHMESIEVFTTQDNVNLVEVFQAIDSSKAGLPDVKNTNALKAYFSEVFPDLDQERVYTSDMKKMVKWYELLKKNEVEFKLSSPATDASSDEEVAAGDTAKEEAEGAEKKATKAKKSTSDASEAAPAKKTAAAKTAAASDDKEAGEAEAPKKKAPRKKKTEE